HGRAKVRSPLDPYRPVATPLRRRGAGHVARLVSYAAKCNSSAPSPRGKTASAERHRHLKVRLGCWETAFWNLLFLAPESNGAGHVARLVSYAAKCNSSAPSPRGKT